MKKKEKLKLSDETCWEFWHPIKGEWYHLAQVYNGKKTIYYTNGKKEDKELKDCDKINK